MFFNVSFPSESNHRRHGVAYEYDRGEYLRGQEPTPQTNRVIAVDPGQSGVGLEEHLATKVPSPRHFGSAGFFCQIRTKDKT